MTKAPGVHHVGRLGFVAVVIATKALPVTRGRGGENGRPALGGLCYRLALIDAAARDKAVGGVGVGVCWNFPGKLFLWACLVRHSKQSDDGDVMYRVRTYIYILPPGVTLQTHSKRCSCNLFFVEMTVWRQYHGMTI